MKGSLNEEKVRIIKDIVLKSFICLMCIVLIKVLVIDKRVNSANKSNTDDKQSKVSDDKSDFDAAFQPTTHDDDTLDKKTSLKFVDKFGKNYDIAIDVSLDSVPYDVTKFSKKNERCSYAGTDAKTKTCVNIAKFQGKIDWNSVKNDGIDFAMLRLGYRGSSEGKLNIDQMFLENLKGAKQAGVDCGVYFFSQAINIEEAKQEANFVLDNIKNENIKYPIAFDLEEPSNSRAKDLSIEQRTSCAVEFCNVIKQAGFTPMVYSNMKWEAFKYDMKALQNNKVEIWYGDFCDKPQTPYNFKMWHYTEKGHVDGIANNVNLSIWMEK